MHLKTDAGESLLARRIVLKLKKPTRNGDNEIAIVTMLPTTIATTAIVTQLYRGRRSVETLFQTVTENYECEIQTLGYPRTALFSSNSLVWFKGVLMLQQNQNSL